MFKESLSTQDYKQYTSSCMCILEFIITYVFVMTDDMLKPQALEIQTNVYQLLIVGI